MNRRRLLFACPALHLRAKTDKTIPGGFVFESHAAGHAIRDRRSFAAPPRTESHDAVIVGGGIAGLSAAWWLRKKGFTRFVLLEGEEQAGGNSRSGQSDVTAYPWAAHYVPVPNPESAHVRQLFEELGLIDANGRFDERWLCHSPQERLFIHGRWHDGIDADRHGTAADRGAFARFHEMVDALRQTKRFTIPKALGYRPNELERISMHDWLRANGLNSAALDWEVDYSCRDEYGGGLRDVNAWAALHYYAARSPQREERGPLTWPEGNGWLMKALLSRVSTHVRTGAWVRAIAREGRRWRVETARVAYRARHVIFAAPAFLAPYLIEGYAARVPWSYSPWMTANLTIENAPDLGETAWDNVIYHSPSLGYVVATHQSLKRHLPRSVWTFYWAFAGDAGRQRRWLMDEPYPVLRDKVLAELERAHPRIRDHVSRVDILRLGHAMRRPVPRLAAEDVMAPAPEGIRFANSDQSNVPVFEEAQYQGIGAADWLMRR
jgi:glycine/D-amino acid oxidase-like deaminating enzyme